MVSDAPGRALCPQILGTHLRCWAAFPRAQLACPCLSPEGLTLPAAMAPGCQLASEGLLCPQEAGSRHLSRNRALGFSGKTERQLPSAEKKGSQRETEHSARPPGSPGLPRGWSKRDHTLPLLSMQTRPFPGGLVHM